MRAIEAVLLDAGGVLLMPDEQLLIREMSAAGIEVDPALLGRAHYAGMNGVDADLSDGVVWDAYNLAYLRTLGVVEDQLPEGRAVLSRVFPTMEWNLVVDSSAAMLPALIDLGLHVAVVSNSDGTVEDLLRSKGVAQVGSGEGAEVVAVIDSHVVGVEKPDAAIFHHALEIVGVAPERAVHVGDSIRFDVTGARSAGVRPLHFDPYEMCGRDDHEHVRDLAEVVGLVGRA